MQSRGRGVRVNTAPHAAAAKAPGKRPPLPSLPSPGLSSPASGGNTSETSIATASTLPTVEVHVPIAAATPVIPSSLKVSLVDTAAVHPTALQSGTETGLDASGKALDASAAARQRRQQFKGVQKTSDGWKASIFAKGTLIDLGLYDTPEAAARGYDKAVLKYKKSRTELNFADSQLSDSEHGEECEVCENGGELLCCDSCSMVFHLGCLEPALPKIPIGHWYCPLCTLLKGRAVRQNCPFCGATDISDPAEMRGHFQRKCRAMRASGKTPPHQIPREMLPPPVATASVRVAPPPPKETFQEGADAETMAEAERILDRILVPTPAASPSKPSVPKGGAAPAKRGREDVAGGVEGDVRSSKRARFPSTPMGDVGFMPPAQSPGAKMRVVPAAPLVDMPDPIPQWFIEAAKALKPSHTAKKAPDAPYFHGSGPWNTDMDVDPSSTAILQQFVREYVAILPPNDGITENPAPPVPTKTLAHPFGESLMLVVFSLMFKLQIAGNIPAKPISGGPHARCAGCANVIFVDTKLKATENLLLRSCTRKTPEFINLYSCTCSTCNRSFHLDCTPERFLIGPLNGWNCVKCCKSAPTSCRSSIDIGMTLVSKLLRQTYKQLVAYAFDKRQVSSLVADWASLQSAPSDALLLCFGA